MLGLFIYHTINEVPKSVNISLRYYVHFIHHGRRIDIREKICEYTRKGVAV
jgi:hypothetical protein